MSKQIIVFLIDEEEYGLDVLAVNGILRANKFTIKKLPGAPKIVEGIINLRGKVNYILNLRHKFGLEPKPISEESKFIMVNLGNSDVGCIVDDVNDIIKLEDSDIQPSPAFVTIDTKYICGIANLEDRMIIILDPASILSMEETAAFSNPLA